MSDGIAGPLRTGPTGRYLVDDRQQPVFLNGDTAWSIAVSLMPDEAAAYFEDRRARGFNAIIVNVIEHLFAPDPPRTPDGLEPFTTSGDLRTPNEAYFARIDTILQMAARSGIHVLASPLYLGYVDPSWPAFGFAGKAEGWHAEVLAAGIEGCREYGRYLGDRWRSLDNLIWVVGGDRNPHDVIAHMRAFAAGILERDDRHLMTAHVHPDEAPAEAYADDTWLTLNQTYSYQIVHQKLLRDYLRNPIRPFVLFESTYEGEHDASDLQIRRQAWWALLCGATGSFFGNLPIWLMAPGWQAALDSPGSRAMGHLRTFTESTEWWRLEPDEKHRFLVAGLGEETGLDRATAALSADGSLAAAYIPTPRTVTVDLERMRGWVLRVKWFDPIDGSWHAGPVLPRRGFVQLETPLDHDVVLLIEDAALGAHGIWHAEVAAEASHP